MTRPSFGGSEKTQTLPQSISKLRWKMRMNLGFCLLCGISRRQGASPKSPRLRASSVGVFTGPCRFAEIRACPHWSRSPKPLACDSPSKPLDRWSCGAQSLDLAQFQKMMKELEPNIHLWSESRKKRLPPLGAAEFLSSEMSLNGIVEWSRRSQNPAPLQKRQGCATRRIFASGTNQEEQKWPPPRAAEFPSAEMRSNGVVEWRKNGERCGCQE